MKPYSWILFFIGLLISGLALGYVITESQMEPELTVGTDTVTLWPSNHVEFQSNAVATTGLNSDEFFMLEPQDGSDNIDALVTTDDELFPEGWESEVLFYVPGDQVPEHFRVRHGTTKLSFQGSVKQYPDESAYTPKLIGNSFLVILIGIMLSVFGIVIIKSTP